MQKKTFGSVLVLAALALMLAACGSSSSGSESAAPAGAVDETNSALISAATGGNVALASGSATLDIPAGALDKDLTLKINTLSTAGAPETARLGSYIFDLGPDGTTFTKPVTLKLKAAVATPKGKEVAIAWLNGTTWTKLEGSTLANGFVSATTTHFSKYVIYFLDGATIIENDDKVCKELNFAACGGDPTGSWQVVSYCIETRVKTDSESGMFSDVAACKNGNTFATMSYEWSGAITFDAAKTFSADFTTTLGASINMKKACLDGIRAANPNETKNMSDSAMCLAIVDMMNKNTTKPYKGAYAAETCTIEGGEVQTNTKKSDGTWSMSGTSLSMLYSGSSTPEVLPICINGSQAVLEFTDADDTNDDGTNDKFYHDHLVLKKK